MALGKNSVPDLRWNGFPARVPCRSFFGRLQVARRTSRTVSASYHLLATVERQGTGEARVTWRLLVPKGVALTSEMITCPQQLARGMGTIFALFKSGKLWERASAVEMQARL